MHGQVSKSFSDKTVNYDLYFGLNSPESWSEKRSWDWEKGKGWLSSIRVQLTPAVNQWDKIFYVHALGNEKPSTQTDTLNWKEDEVQSLILQLTLSNYEIFANRIFILNKYAKEDDPTVPGIEVGSLKNFYKFLKLYKNIKCPSMSLTPDHTIYASWKEKTLLLSMNFLSDGNINFVIFQTNDIHPERKNRLSGTATSDTLNSIIASEILITFYER